MSEDLIALAEGFARRHEALGARLMRPERARRAQCVATAIEVLESERGGALRSLSVQRGPAGADGLRYALAAGAETVLAQRVWEALAPEGWVGDPRRSFQDAEGKVTEHPSTITAALTLGADAVGLVTAEESAREGLARLVPLGMSLVDPVRWIVAPRAILSSHRDDNVWRNTSDDFWFDAMWLLRTAARGVDGYERVLSDVSTVMYAALERAQRLTSIGYASVSAGRMLEGAFWWDRALARGASLAASSHVDKRARVDYGRALSELPEAFGPLMNVYALGYGIAAARRGALVLVAESL